MKPLKYIILFGNLLFILWMFYNGMDEGWKGATGPEIVSYIGLTALLILNSVLIMRKK
jgi:hypothetical protein